MRNAKRGTRNEKTRYNIQETRNYDQKKMERIRVRRAEMISGCVGKKVDLLDRTILTVGTLHVVNMKSR